MRGKKYVYLSDSYQKFCYGTQLVKHLSVFKYPTHHLNFKLKFYWLINPWISNLSLLHSDTLWLKTKSINNSEKNVTLTFEKAS